MSGVMRGDGKEMFLTAYPERRSLPQTTQVVRGDGKPLHCEATMMTALEMGHGSGACHAICRGRLPHLPGEFLGYKEDGA